MSLSLYKLSNKYKLQIQHSNCYIFYTGLYAPKMTLYNTETLKCFVISIPLPPGLLCHLTLQSELSMGTDRQWWCWVALPPVTEPVWRQRDNSSVLIRLVWARGPLGLRRAAGISPFPLLLQKVLFLCLTRLPFSPQSLSTSPSLSILLFFSFSSISPSLSLSSPLLSWACGILWLSCSVGRSGLMLKEERGVCMWDTGSSRSVDFGTHPLVPDHRILHMHRYNRTIHRLVE